MQDQKDKQSKSGRNNDDDSKTRAATRKEPTAVEAAEMHRSGRNAAGVVEMRPERPDN